jgi:hypothetical protein
MKLRHLRSQRSAAAKRNAHELQLMGALGKEAKIAALGVLLKLHLTDARWRSLNPDA